MLSVCDLVYHNLVLIEELFESLGLKNVDTPILKGYQYYDKRYVQND